MKKRRKKLRRQLLAFVLSVGMIFGLMPGGVTIAYADDVDAAEQPDDEQGLLWRYEGEDGEDYIGYSGRFISEKAYREGFIWNQKASPDSICYYVHAGTIQGVVDKLLALDGKEVQVRDRELDKETTVTIHNSGFIYLNMSYRDSRYKKAVETEQYVYAPASVRGIFMETASNSYSIPTMNQEGERIDYNTVLEFPLTENAQTTIKKYDGSGAESDIQESEYDSEKEIEKDGKTETIRYLHGIALQNWYLEDIVSSKLAGLIELKQNENKDINEENESQRKWIVQNAVYDKATDSWRTTEDYYLIAATDLYADETGVAKNIEQYAVIQKEQHRWPSLHVNASTQVRVSGLWTEKANLYMGFYKGADDIHTYVGSSNRENATITEFTPEKIGTTETVTYSDNYSVEYDPDLGRVGEEHDNETSVNVHVLQAESNTDISDSYSEGEKKASIAVKEAALSDLVPMSDNEKEQLIDGASLDIHLSISGTDENDEAVAKAKKEISKLLGDGEQTKFFDAKVNYTLKKDGQVVTDKQAVTQLNEYMQLCLPYNNASAESGKCAVYRYHDGKVDKLMATMNEDGTLSFETDRFSVYAIAEDDKAEEFTGINIDSSGNLKIGENVCNDNYYRVFGSGSTTSYICLGNTEPADNEYTFYYNSKTHTLILNHADISLAEGTVISSDYGTENDRLIIELLGRNSLSTKKYSAVFLNGNTVITAKDNGTLTAQGGENQEDGYYPPAIEIGDQASVFSNYADITVKASGENSIGFAAWGLTCGEETIEDEEGNKQTAKGTIINFGTITGRIGLFGSECENLISCETRYEKPTDHAYIGKAYYFTNETFYPNNMYDKLNDGDWRVVGKYENEKARPSSVFYQWIYVDAVGSIYTEDRTNPIQFLVYPEDAPDGKIEKLLTQNDVAAVDDGKEHTFDTDLYTVWFTNGNVTVNGNVLSCVDCASAPEEEWKDADELKRLIQSWDKSHLIDDQYGKFDSGNGAVCYVKDENGKVQFQDSSKSSITINGDTGCFCLHDSYQGSATVSGDINFCTLADEREFLNKWIYRLQWQYDESPYAPEETYYCALPKAGKVVENGAFTQKIKDMKLAADTELKGMGVYDGTYYSQTETKVSVGDKTETVAGTSAVINENTIFVNVSKTNGLEENTYPLVRKTKDDALNAIKSKLSDTADMVAMDISMIRLPEDVMNGKQEAVEPNGAVNLYFDKADLKGLTKPALYHMKDDGTIEKIAFTQDAASGRIQCQTTSFSTYVFAEDQNIKQQPSGGGSTGGSTGGTVSGGGSSAGGGMVVNPDNKTEDTKTEVKPDGTRVETKTDTVKNDQGNEVKSETTTIKNADGTVVSVTTTIEIKDAATNTTINMVVKKDAAGEVTEAKAEIEAVAAAGKNGKAKTTLNADAAEQMIQAAGTKNVTIKQTVRDDKGNTLYTVETDAKNLEEGRKLTLVEIKDGKQILVAKTTKVDTNGNFTIRAPKGEYQLLNETQMKTLRKQILATVKPAKKSVTIKKGKKAAISLSKKLDKENVAKITYRSTEKSVVTITKNGKATGKKKGTAVIEITVVLNDGTKKVIKTKVTVMNKQ